MLLQDAQRRLANFLSPLTLDAFLDSTLTGGFRKIGGVAASGRADLLGPDPGRLLGGAFHLAPRLTFHSARPLGPPPSLQGVASAADFRSRIAEFHARNYSVRFPDLRPLSAPLDRLARALEVMFHQPVSASAFWSREGITAPTHSDAHDLLVVQLRGAKRWRISTEPSALLNDWKGISETQPVMGAHEVVDVAPGDVLYLQRGTLHDVESDEESLHVAIGFTPLTVREAMIAAVDHLSDLDRDMRATLGERLGPRLATGTLDPLAPPVSDAFAHLLAVCRSPGFLAQALQRRSSRTVATLATLPAPAPLQIDLDTILVRRDTAFCHLTASAEMLDFSYPGGRLSIHRGAQESVVFIANAAEFRVRDIPGPIDDDVRLSLAGKFLEVGFLEAAPRRAARGSAAA